ncbi:protein of unassigned function [Methylobacterium oryzae CBMB20]|uniref:Protein of unassigned function n=1 Tax=Methylobacterium oryzae CBMB20 TaxID=693986 RepID=A0A089NMX3_9HYPH|nr:protein of unassigned function [Methylobacterium oryzae CBMB20]
MTDRGRFALSTIDGRSLSLPSHILLDVLGRTLRRPGRA